jgi:hypothetical protein
MVRLSILLDTWNDRRVGMLALIRPVMTSTLGRCVASIRWMPAARAFCARRAISSSTFLPTTIIRSASSSITTTMKGSRSSGSGDSGVRLNGFGMNSPRSGGVVDLLVVAGQVAHAQLAHELVAALHLGHAPVQRVAGLLHVGDHRRQQVRNAS